MIRDVARGEHVRQRRPAALVHEHAVVDLARRPPPAAPCWARSRSRPPPGRTRGRAPSWSARAPRGRAFERRHRILRDPVDALLAMDVREHLTDLVAENPGQGHARCSTATTSTPSWRNEADTSEPMKPSPITTARRPRGGGADAVTVLDGAKLEDAGQIGARAPYSVGCARRWPPAAGRTSCARRPRARTTFCLASIAVARVPSLSVMRCSA